MINHEIKGSISTITLDNHRNHNAFSDLLIKDFTNILELINKNEKIRAVILKASGQNFSSGADLNWMQSMANSSEQVNEKDALLLAELLDKLNTLSKPTVALVQGRTYGGALGLLACCDIVIAESCAQFCFSEVKLGLIPATIAPYVIQCIGSSAATRYFITAEMFDAATAEQLRLVHICCDKGNLESTAEKIIQSIQNNGPCAITAVKQLTQKIDAINPALKQETAKLLASIRVSDEGQEGINAFLEKRNPAWKEQ